MTRQTSMWQRATTKRFLIWLFSWRTVRRMMIGFATLATLVALFYAEENWRGKRAWDRCRQELEARGEQLDFKALIPRPVPDNQNFAMTPVIRSSFSQLGRKLWKDNNYVAAARKVTVGKDHRQFMDLVAWARAYEDTNSNQKVGSGGLDLESRAKTASAVLDALKTNDAVFAELRDASRRPYCRYPNNYDVENPFEILLPYLNSVRGVCRLLQLKACAELAGGRSAEALEDVKLILYMADSVKEEPFIVSYLVRLACVRLAIQPIWEGLAERVWSDAQLRELQTRLQEYNFLGDLKRPLDAERATAIVMIDLVRRRGLGFLSTLSNDTPSNERWLANTIGLLIPRGWYYQERVGYCRLFNTLLDGTVDPAQRRVFLDRIASNDREFVRSTHGNGRAVDAFAAIFVHHRVIAAMLLPALSQIITKAAVGQTVVNEAALACALERYRLANGNFPEKLDALAPSYISPLPRDVITGEPYKYRRTDDGQFILYSVGWNEKDDGGIPGKTDFDEKEGDWIWQYPKL